MNDSRVGMPSNLMTPVSDFVGVVGVYSSAIARHGRESAIEGSEACWLLSSGAPPADALQARNTPKAILAVLFASAGVTLSMASPLQGSDPESPLLALRSQLARSGPSMPICLRLTPRASRRW